MNTKSYSWIRSFFILFGVLFIVFLGACTHHALTLKRNQAFASLPRGAPVKELTSSERSIVFEDTGTIVVYHGNGCAENNQNGGLLAIEESLDLPLYATKAAVFLNGWNLRYLDDDHNVTELTTAIDSIRLEGKTLKWRASGQLADDGGDDPYSWCYYYTVTAWNPSSISLTIDQADAVSGFNSGFTTALTSFSSFLQNPDFASSKSVAILPRGFRIEWLCVFSCDHNLAQIGLNLDHSEIFIEEKPYMGGNGFEIPQLPNSASQVDSGFVSWETSIIFKDDDDRRNYDFEVMVSALGGNDVGMIQPPFSILPEPTVSAVVGPPGLQTREVTIDNVPFEYAIPVLTGWSLHYPEGDKNVGDIGTWIDEIHYRDPNDPPGRLRYKVSSVLTDNESATVHFFKHKVTIVGIKPVSRGGTPSQRVPDLVPFSPVGTEPSAFCRLEEQATKLRVSVKNQGNEAAAASKTTVLFSSGSVTVDTPPLPAGGSVDLLFNIPLGCFSPDCSFKITVDSNDQIHEANENNNTVNGGCIG